MSKQSLSAVLVGCGAICRRWLQTAAEIRGLRIVGLVDLDLAAAEQRREDFGLKDAAVGTDLRAMLRQVEPDVVFDCTVPEAHVKVTLEALRHGRHVLGEKPMADTMANARRMVAAAKQAGRIYAVIQNRRYNPHIRAFRRLLDSGRIGDLTTLNADFYLGAHFGGFRRRMEHVLLLDMAIHTFDEARLISGENPVAVYCHEWNPEGSWYDHDASAVAVFEMTNGVVFTYRGSWCSEGFNTTWDADWRAIGSKGSALWDGAEDLRAEACHKPKGLRAQMREVPVPARKMPHQAHAALIREFLRCVRTGAVPETTCEDNIKSLAMVHAAVKSARLGRRVKVEV